MRRIAIIAVLLVAVILVAGVALILQTRGRSVTSQPLPPGESVTRATGKPKPVSDYFKGCPPSGDGGDPVLNTLKNRMDESVWQPTTIADIMLLDWPKAIEGRPRARWSEADKADIAEHEGSPVQIEGYSVTAKRMSPESCNCHSKDDRDFQRLLVESGRGVLAVLTKGDKLTRSARAERRRALVAALELPEDQVHVTSSASGEGIAELGTSIIAAAGGGEPT